VPRYLKPDYFETLQRSAPLIEVTQASLGERLSREPEESIDRFVLLDAQDWMDDTKLTMLWREIQRTASPDAKVIFRTAGATSVLPGRIPEDILASWHYDQDQSRAFHAQDRSSIYGGFHMYSRVAHKSHV
jgi:S-adenosylmethionine-diacylglycerol 3-amino-3-carboxypropyl transferase